MKYPNGLKNVSNKIINYSNRGMSLENEINTANEYYRLIDKAIIYKKPTPIKIVKVDYPSRDKATIKEAYFTVPSTTDYNGIYKGKYIDFEAKETKSKTSFSLNNIHKHQITHLQNITKHKGIAFLIDLLTEEKLTEFLNSSTRNSIPISYFRENSYLIKDSLKPTIDYLKIVDQILGGD